MREQNMQNCKPRRTCQFLKKHFCISDSPADRLPNLNIHLIEGACGAGVGPDHWSRCISTADCDSFKVLAGAGVAEFMKYSGALVKKLCAIYLLVFWPLRGKFYKNSGNPVTTSFPSQIPSTEKTLTSYSAYEGRWLRCWRWKVFKLLFSFAS